MSRPRGEDLDRVVALLGRGTAPSAQRVDALLGDLRGESPALERRIALARQASPPAPRRLARARRGRSPRRHLVPVLLVLALAALVARTLRPPAPLHLRLDSGEDWASLRPTEAVSLAFRGSGAVGGDTRAVRVDWEAGTVDVAVDPSQRAGLVVSTPEAEVRVVGTAFTVTRDALGTAVSVSRGRVELRCTDGWTGPLAAGDARTCVPTTAAGRLARARTLQASGAETQALLDEVDRALAGSGEAAVLGDLQVIRIQALISLGRQAEALDQAEAYLADSDALRADEVRRVAARLALTAGGCARARPHLLALRDPLPAEAAWIEHCGAEAAP